MQQRVGASREKLTLHFQSPRSQALDLTENGETNNQGQAPYQSGTWLETGAEAKQSLMMVFFAHGYGRALAVLITSYVKQEKEGIPVSSKEVLSHATGGRRVKKATIVSSCNSTTVWRRCQQGTYGNE